MNTSVKSIFPHKIEMLFLKRVKGISSPPNRTHVLLSNIVLRCPLSSRRMHAPHTTPNPGRKDPCRPYANCREKEPSALVPEEQCFNARSHPSKQDGPGRQQGSRRKPAQHDRRQARRPLHQPQPAAAAHTLQVLAVCSRLHTVRSRLHADHPSVVAINNDQLIHSPK